MNNHSTLINQNKHIQINPNNNLILHYPRNNIQQIYFMIGTF